MAFESLSASPANLVFRILVADDDSQILRLFERILTRQGYTVIAVNSGTDAAKIIEECAIDLLVLDLSMPKPDGFDLLKSLKSKRPNLKILVISGFMSSVLLEASEMLGASASLSKTQAPQLLAETVARLLQPEISVNHLPETAARFSDIESK